MSHFAKPFIKRMHLKNFRSFRDETIEFANSI
jgi:AAA15 family ATPase/GTPase